MPQQPGRMGTSIRTGGVILALAASMIFMTRALAAAPDLRIPAAEAAPAAEPAALWVPDPVLGGFWRPAGSDAVRPTTPLAPGTWQPVH